MSSLTLSVKFTKKCAFCKYWNDPTNSAITPKAPAIGMWQINDINQKSMCLKKNIPMQANAFCSSDYVCKL